MNIHFIAIGGSIMHNLAITLSNKGYQVTGSDDQIYEPAKSRLADHELLPSQTGWMPQRVDQNLDAVILGMHAKQDNPELQRARELNIPIYSFPEYVYEQIKDKERVVIAGSHGKTTITSMILHVLRYTGKEFDYLVGADIEGFDLMVKLSQDAPLAVLEGDEYLTSTLDSSPKFLHYYPHIALISGIAWDHINVFPTYEEYFYQFERLLSSLEPAGQLIYYQDDPEVQRLVEHGRNDLICIPYSQPAYTPYENGSVIHLQKEDLFLPIFGSHNMANLEGARQVCRQLDIADHRFWEAMQSFSGAGKRLELLAEGDNCSVYRDFAHAPSKVDAVVKALKDQYPQRKLIACLELHTYSSLQKHFLPHYAGTMDAADSPIVYFYYHTLVQKRLPELAEEDIRDGFRNQHISVFKDKEDFASFLKKLNLQHANLLFMSSGHFDGLDITSLASSLCQKDNQRNQ